MRGHIVRLLTVALSTPGLAVAQNLIPNPGFEDYIGDCTFGVGMDDVEHWSFPDCANPGAYYHSCNNIGAPNGGVPVNIQGVEQPHSGSAYAGIAPFVTLAQNGTVHSYASVDFLSPLVAGEDYCLRFFISRADSSRYAVGTLHAFLWYSLPSICNYNDTAWDTYAAATFDISSVGPDGWYPMEAQFTANGAEANLTMGTFLFGAEFDTTYLGPLPINNALYYFDDFYLGPCDLAVQEVSASSDLVLTPLLTAVQVSWPSTSSYHTLNLYDTQGRLLRSVRVQSNTATVPVHTSGIFLIEALGPGLRTVCRVVVQ